MLTLTEHSKIVGEIYDCVAEPERWTATLQMLCDRYDGTIATMGLLDTKNNSTRFGAACGPAEIVTPLITKYAADMPFYHIIPRMEVDVPVTMDAIFDLAGPGARDFFYSTRLGQEWAIPNGMQDGLCLAMVKQEERIGTLVITTMAQRRPLSQEDVEDFALLAPHIRRAVTIGDLFELKGEETRLYQSLLDELGSAVLVVAPDMKLTYANARGQELLLAGRVLGMKGETVYFSDPFTHRSILKAITTSERNEFSLGPRGIGLPTTQSAPPVVAHILPLQRRSAQGRIADGAIAIFITEVGAAGISAVDALASFFGLTPAEKRIAAFVAAGRTRAEIAIENGVADGTVKSQLDAIFTKTETGNQRALQNLIRDLSPPLRAR